MENWGKPFVTGLISGNVCAFSMMMALVAGATSEYWILLAAVPVLLVIPQLTLVLFSRWTDLPHPAWWHGLVYLALGTLASFPLFFLMVYIVEAAFDNRITPLLFWCIYGLNVGLIGMVLLIAYRAMFLRR